MFLPLPVKSKDTHNKNIDSQFFYFIIAQLSYFQLTNLSVKALHTYWQIECTYYIQNGIDLNLQSDAIFYNYAVLSYVCCIHIAFILVLLIVKLKKVLGYICHSCNISWKIFTFVDLNISEHQFDV